MRSVVLRRLTAFGFSFILCCGLIPVVPMSSSLIIEQAYAIDSVASFTNVQSSISSAYTPPRKEPVYISWDADTSTLTFTGKGRLARANDNFTKESLVGSGVANAAEAAQWILDNVKCISIGDTILIQPSYFSTATFPKLVSVVVKDAATQVKSQALLTKISELSAPDAVTDEQGITYTDSTKKKILKVEPKSSFITIPSSVTEIDGIAFDKCGSSLKTITVDQGNSTYKSADGILYKGNDVIYVPKGIEGKVVVLEGVTALKYADWQGRSGIKELALPATFTSIDYLASFLQTLGGLNSLTVADGNGAYKARDGILYSAKNATLTPLATISNLPSAVTVLDGVTTFPNELFSKKTTLQTITIPASVTLMTPSVGGLPFSGCTNLKQINLAEGSTFTFRDGVLKDKDGNILFEVAYPDGRSFSHFVKDTTTATIEADYWMHDYTFRDSFSTITKIETKNTAYTVANTGALYSADMKTLYKVPVSATGAFQVPSTVTRIAPYAFAGCSKLTQIIMSPQGVEDIGTHALDGTRITGFTLPSTLWKDTKADDFPQDPVMDYTLFNAGALWSGEQLEQRMNETLAQLDFDLYQQSFLPNYAFSGLKLIKTITLPKSVASLGKGTFYGCPNLNTVYTFNQNLQVSVASRTGDATLGWSEATPSSFSARGEGSSFVTRTGITFYALNFASNTLKKYCDENGSTFVPMVFLGNYSNKNAMANKVEGGESTLNALTNSNTVSISNMVATGAELTPTIKVKYTNDPAVAERVLQPGTDCTVAYTDNSGKTVSAISAPGTYTATVTGDDKSVFGTTRVVFRVTDGTERNVPPVTVEDTWNTGAKATANFQGSVVEGAEAATISIVPVTAQNDAERYNKLMAVMGAGDLAGLFSVNLHVDGEHIREGFGSITLSFPVDAGFNGRTATVHHLHEDGTVTDTTAVVTGGMVTITVTSLSDFAIEVAKQSGTPQQAAQQQGGTAQPQQAALPLNQASAQTATGSALPQTGDNTHGVVGGVAALAALSTGLALFARRKRAKYER